MACGKAIASSQPQAALTRCRALAPRRHLRSGRARDPRGSVTAPSPTASTLPASPPMTAPSAAGSTADGRPRSARGTPLGSALVERGEDLAAARVDYGEHAVRPSPASAPLASAARLENAEQPDRQRLCEPARGRDAHAQAGEGPGPDPDGDAVESFPPDPGLLHELLRPSAAAESRGRGARPAQGRRARSASQPSARRSATEVEEVAVSIASVIIASRPRGRASSTSTRLCSPPAWLRVTRQTRPRELPVALGGPLHEGDHAGPEVVGEQVGLLLRAAPRACRDRGARPSDRGPGSGGRC